MNVETTTQTELAPAMPIVDLEESASSARTVLYAPPFAGHWHEERSPNPHGYWSYCGLDSNSGLVHLQLGRQPENGTGGRGHHAAHSVRN